MTRPQDDAAERHARRKKRHVAPVYLVHLPESRRPNLRHARRGEIDFCFWRLQSRYRTRRVDGGRGKGRETEVVIRGYIRRKEENRTNTASNDSPETGPSPTRPQQAAQGTDLNARVEVNPSRHRCCVPEGTPNGPNTHARGNQSIWLICQILGHFH